LDRQWTHSPFLTLHRGWEEGQSEFTAHSTQTLLTGSQAGLLAGHSALELHAAHVPEATSQRGVPEGHEALPVQARWHW
jgi:hypothetical protein